MMERMPLIALGLNHQTAPLPVREAVAFAPEALAGSLEPIRAGTRAEEVVLLSTCNRTELYLRGDAAGLAHDARAWLNRQAATRVGDLSPHLYMHADERAARHAFRVASGLDSAVLGETQVLGQLKRAVRQAGEAGTLGGSLQRLFQRAFTVAKEVRAGTAIGATCVSFAAVAVRLAAQVFGDANRSKVLLVGAGEMIENLAAHFAAASPAGIWIANRTAERGAALAERFGARSMRLAEVPARLHEFDVVASCTASTLPLIGKGMVERALRARRRRPMLLIDLAVPRDIEPEVGELEDVFLHTVDTLGEITRRNGGSRLAAVAQAEAIVERHVEGFARWMRARAAVPHIRSIRTRAEHERQLEVARAMQRLERGEDAADVLEEMSRRLGAKLLHPAMRALNANAGEEPEAIAGMLGKLFRKPA